MIPLSGAFCIRVLLVVLCINFPIRKNIKKILFYFSYAFSSTLTKSSTHKSCLKCFEAVAISIDTLVWWKNLEASIENVQRSDLFSHTSCSSIVVEVICKMQFADGWFNNNKSFYSKDLLVFYNNSWIKLDFLKSIISNWYLCAILASATVTKFGICKAGKSGTILTSLLNMARVD
jgi:hypothetical protein